MNEVLKSISLMIPNGLRLELPTNVNFDNYAQVKKTLLTAGSKYKKCGFEFKEDAAVVQARLLGGEAINDKKKFQFFATPAAVVELLIGRAGVEPYMVVLEPSAGQGAIVDAINLAGGFASIIELMPENINVLNRKYEQELSPKDFLKVSPDDHIKYDRIIANPPFTKNQDIDHVLHMYDFLDDGGRIVSVTSKSWQHGSQKKQIAFRKWLDEVGATVEEIPAGAFKESGTNISTLLVTIDK